eukprot:COSAG01_NODE_800_length_13475_cov_24.171725_10_plen_47_part_00
MPFLLAHAPYIHTCPTKNSHADPKIDFRWPRAQQSARQRCHASSAG